MKLKIMTLFSIAVVFGASNILSANQQTKEEKPYSLSYIGPKLAKAQVATACKLAIIPNAGWELKTGSDAPPFKAALTPTPGISLEKSKFVNTDLKEAGKSATTKEISTAFTPNLSLIHI